MAKRGGRRRKSRPRSRGGEDQVQKNWITQCKTCGDSQFTFSSSGKTATCTACGEVHTYNPQGTEEDPDDT